jgi:hypothetical protein
MKEIMQEIGLWIELVLEGSSQPLGRWRWSSSVPREGELVEHEDADLEVIRVRWSTQDPSIVRLIVRAQSRG